VECTCYYSKQFNALRNLCIGEDQFILSLSRSKSWSAKGGKSGSNFCKTLDNQFVLKEISSIELEAFLESAALYFEYLYNAVFQQVPTILGKIYGVYTVKFKTSNGKQWSKDIIVMENLFYAHNNITQIYDLKGSKRSRYVNPKDSEVLLDQNLLEVMFTSPLWVHTHSKAKLGASIWNDTLFLSSLGVMDYSLLVGIDNTSKQIVVGIIDYIRKYTWDKYFENLLKSSGIMGGKGVDPTVISPDQYKLRFREAINFYVIPVPHKYSNYYLRNPVEQEEEEET